METIMSKRICELRKKLKLTQKQLSDETGLSLSAIKSYENAIREPNSKAMAALENFFNVSGKYLRGETDDPFLHSWDDKEVMEHVHNTGLHRLASKVIEAARASDECSEKMTYDILAELRHILNLEVSQKPAAMKLLQETFGITIKYIDSCLYSLRREKSWFESFKMDRIQDFIAALNNFEYREQGSIYNILPMDLKIDLPADKKEIAVFFQPAAAGTGTFLDSDDYDMVDVPINSVTIRASFGVRVSGDSMEPEFDDEDIVFVKQQRTLDSGEIGIFILNGDAFIKKLMKIKNKYQLVSLNPVYKPIDVHADDELRVVGKVIGKYIDE